MCRRPYPTTECPRGNLSINTVGDDGNLCSITTLLRGDSYPATSLVLVSPCSTTMGADENSSSTSAWKPVVDRIVDTRKFLLDRVVLVRNPLLIRVASLAEKR